MAVIKCKMCGGNLVIEPGGTVAECEYCGSRQTVPTADNEKKMVQFERAERLRKNCEFDKAEGIYESIVSEFRTESEAYWGLFLCKYGIEYVEDPATGKKIPTCHRSSFDSVMEDSDLDQALENADAVARKVYREEAKQIEEIRKGIIEVSGKEQPYDIFICYKETDENGQRTLDSVLAQEVYDALTGKGYRVFFARITLEDKLGQEYEPYIFAALNSAKIMLAFGTDYEYFNAVWVKNEWSRFLKLMVKDKSKHLIPCYKGLDAYDMPKEFLKLQAQDLGKMGAIQDILRGVEKLLPKAEPTVVRESVVAENTGVADKITSLLDRGYMALEDGEWQKADSFFEEVLNNNSRNAQAYIGKALAEKKCSSMGAFVSKVLSQDVYAEILYLEPDTEHIERAIKKYQIPGYLEEPAIRTLYHFDLSYSSEVSCRKRQYQEESNRWETNRLLSRAEKFATGQSAQDLQSEKKHLFTQLADRVKNAQKKETAAIGIKKKAYVEHILRIDTEVEKLYLSEFDHRERDYQNWIEEAKTRTSPVNLLKLAFAFEGLHGYKESSDLADHCRKRAAVAQRETISAGYGHTVGIKTNGTVVAAGYTEDGRCDIRNWSSIVAVGASYHTVGLKADGTVIAIGNNDDSQCDVSRWKDIVAISAGENHTVGLRADGTVVAVGNNDDGQCNVSEWKNIVAVTAGNGFFTGGHTVGLRADGTVVAVGNHSDGRCDVGSWTDIGAVSAGENHTVGLKTDGTVVAVGNNEAGQCNVNNWFDIVAVSAGRSYTVGLKSNGLVIATGDNENGQCDVSRWQNIVAISASDHTVGLKTDGTVVAVGDNSGNQCKVYGWKNIRLPNQ